MLQFLSIAILLCSGIANLTYAQAIDWTPNEFATIEEIQALGNARHSYMFFQEQKRLGNPALEDLTWEQLFPNPAVLVPVSHWVPEGHQVMELTPEGQELVGQLIYGPIAVLGRFASFVTEQELLLNGYTEYEARGLGSGAEVLTNFVQPGAGMLKPGLARSTNFVRSRLAQAGKGAGTRPLRRFVPTFESLDDKICASSGGAPMADYSKPWRNSGLADSGSLFPKEALAKARLGPKVGEGCFHEVSHVENLVAPGGERLVFRRPLTPSERRYTNQFHVLGHRAGVYAFGKSVSIHGFRGYLDYYRGRFNWKERQKLGDPIQEEEFYLLGEQLYVAGIRGYMLEDVQGKNIVEGYIVDPMPSRAADAFDYNADVYDYVRDFHRNAPGPSFNDVIKRFRSITAGNYYTH